MRDLPSEELLKHCRSEDEEAAKELFDRYAGRLIGLARSRLARRLSSRVDPEDVVQSAFRSFFLLTREGEVTLHESGDLWRILVRITLRKVYRTARRHHAERRDVGRERAATGELKLDAPSHEPTPAEAAELVDEVRRLLAPLSPIQRRAVEMRLQGHDVDAIAAEMERSPRTVRRLLAGIGTELERRLKGDEPTPEQDLIPYHEIVLLRQVGQGGMGKIYRATWRGSDKPVAVKLLHKPLREFTATSARLRGEAAFLAQLRHPGIVTLHGVGKLPDGGHFLVMEFVEGSDLSRQEAPSVASALRWVAEAAEAVEYAHKQGIIHCDLKPSNLLLDREGHIHITDFGLARTLSDGATPIGGTPGFMAPEQLNADAAVSPSIDIYALGAVLKTLLNVRPPEVDQVCQHCMAHDPEDRFASATELALCLRSLIT